MSRLLCIVASILTSFCFAQQKKQFTVKYSTEPITLDGALNESAWQTADSAKDFWQYFPTDSVLATQPSEIKMLYDNTTLYIGITVKAAGNKFVTPTLKRDFRAGNSDNITLMFDTFNDGANAFLFGINPYGVRREGLVSGGGSDLRGFNITWDVKWKAETKIYDDYYVAEMAIPLTSFKFKEGETKWWFNRYRFDTQSNEQSTWINIPRNQFIFNLAFMGDMIFEKPLGKSKTPMALIPYVNTLIGKDYETNETTSDFKFGGDAKISIGNSMNLDITVNPDFSQVEVDDQVTNLTRFEVSLPEKRQFFIDNSDLFSDFGDNREANPFFSRRIGIAKDTAGNTIENKIIAGVRLSGKIDENWRLGFLNIQTEKDEANNIPSNNNTVLAIQRKVFSRSNIGLIFVNRQSFSDENYIAPEDKYNRVIGVDYNLASADNTWVGRFFLHNSFAPNENNKNQSAGISLNYNSRNYKIGFESNYIGANFRSDLGFIRRTDILKINPEIERIFWSESKSVNYHSISFEPIFFWRPELDYKNSDYLFITAWETRFNDQSEFRAALFNRFTYLTDEFDPTGTDGVPLPANQGYYYNSVSLRYQSDRRKAFAYSLNPSIGRFYNGNKYSFEANIGIRVQPKFFASVNVNFDRIELPNPHPSASIWLIGPKLDVTFNRSLFWSTFIQYSNQRDNLGINTRLQWRFAPLSDLFIVYNDNYFTNTIMPKNRSINLKLTYWLNI